MILFKLHIRVPFSKQDEALELFNNFIGPGLVLPGLIDAGLYTNPEGDELVLLEEWRTKEEMEEHLRSVEFRNILAVMEFAREVPEVQLYIPSTTGGIEWLKDLRVYDNDST